VRFVLGADDTNGRSGEHADMARALLATALIAAALSAAACGEPPGRNAPDGTVVTQDGVDYAVQTSRELNPEAPDDRVFLGGEDIDRPGVTLVGVFLQARNAASGARTAVAAPQLVNAFGKTYEPMRLPRSDVFAYRARELEPGEEIPGPDSVARESPQNGALVVYRVPTGEFATDRPFTVRFGPDEQAASVQLDL
jgi:hypothetical protein